MCFLNDKVSKTSHVWYITALMFMWKFLVLFLFEERTFNVSRICWLDEKVFDNNIYSISTYSRCKQFREYEWMKKYSVWSLITNLQHPPPHNTPPYTKTTQTQIALLTTYIRCHLRKKNSPHNVIVKTKIRASKIKTESFKVISYFSF